MCHLRSAIAVTLDFGLWTLDSGPSTLNSQPSTTLYTCQMASHDVVSDKPGKCPKCEMDLVPTSTVPHGKAMEEKWRKQHEPTAQHEH